MNMSLITSSFVIYVIVSILHTFSSISEYYFEAPPPR
jgi:hypothetical protein